MPLFDTKVEKNHKKTEKEQKRDLKFKLLLYLGDLFSLGFALFFAIFTSSKYSHIPIHLHWGWFLLYFLLWSLASLFFDLYNLKKASRHFYSAYISGKVAALASIIYSLAPYLFIHIPYARSLWLFLLIFSILSIALWRYLFARLMPLKKLSEKLIILGACKAGNMTVKAIKSKGDGRYNIVGFVDERKELKGKRVEGVPVLGSTEELVPLMETSGTKEVVCAITENLSDKAFRALLNVRERGWQIISVSAFYEDLTGSVPVQYDGRHLNLLIPPVSLKGKPIYDLWKRALDIVAGVTGVFITGLLIPFLWVANKIFSPGPIFYRQKRIGKGHKPFYLLKLRSMVPNAETETGAVWTKKDDERITKIGRILRKTHLDELPQFWNVLKGEMSLIGPRPERPEFVSELDKKIPFFRLRHSVKPGLTGWAQVNLGYINSYEGTVEKIQYDLYYIKNRSLYMDLLILFLTFREIFGLNGT